MWLFKGNKFRDADQTCCKAVKSNKENGADYANFPFHVANVSKKLLPEHHNKFFCRLLSGKLSVK